MAINRSQFRRKVDWDGPQVARRKHILTEADIWKKRFFIALVVGGVLVLLLGIGLGIAIYKYERSVHPAQSSTENQVSQAVDLKTYESVPTHISFKYPSSWTVKTKPAATDLDILDVEFSTKVESVTASFTLNVIKNQDVMTLDAWVKRFGVQNTETKSATVGGQSALSAQFTGSASGETQQVYYVSNNTSIYVLNAYQSGGNDALASQLSALLASVTFTSASTNAPSQAPATEAVPTPSTTSRIIVNNVVSEKVDSILSLARDGSNTKEIFNDKQEKVFYKNVGAVASSLHTFFGYFGTSTGSASDGIYSVDLTSGSAKLTAVKKGITPGIIRVSGNGKVLVYLDGARGTNSSIVFASTTGTTQKKIFDLGKVMDFDVSEAGDAVAVAIAGSPTVLLYKDTGVKSGSVTLSTKNILRLSWVSVTSGNETTNSFAFVVDSGTSLTSKSELYFGSDKNAKQLTSDAFVQDAPLIAPDKKTVFYESYVASTTPKISIWNVGVDGKNDTNILKGKNQHLLGIL